MMGLNTSTSLLKSVMISSTLALALGIILFLFGGMILAKGLKCIKFTRGVSGLWFFGYLTYLLGIVIIVNVSPSDPTTALWIVFGCTIGFAILGAILCGAIGILGDIILGAASGFSVLVIWFYEKAHIFPCIWIGSVLLANRDVNIIIHSIVLSGNFYALVSGSLAIHIIAIITTFLVFGIASYLHHISNSSTHQPVEKQEET